MFGTKGKEQKSYYSVLLEKYGSASNLLKLTSEKRAQFKFFLPHSATFTRFYSFRAFCSHLDFTQRSSFVLFFNSTCSIVFISIYFFLLLLSSHVINTHSSQQNVSSLYSVPDIFFASRVNILIAEGRRVQIASYRAYRK